MLPVSRPPYLPFLPNGWGSRTTGSLALPSNFKPALRATLPFLLKVSGKARGCQRSLLTRWVSRGWRHPSKVPREGVWSWGAWVRPFCRACSHENWVLCGIDVCVCCAQSLSRVRLFGTPWNVALQAPLSMGFSRQEYWGRLPFPPPEDLLNPGIEPAALESPALAGGFLTTEPPGK